MIIITPSNRIFNMDNVEMVRESGAETEVYLKSGNIIHSFMDIKEWKEEIEEHQQKDEVYSTLK